MTSVENAYGNSNLSVVILKIGIAFLFACCGYWISYLMGGESVFAKWLSAPFLGPTIFGGIQWIFWIVLSKEICGKYYGIVTALFMTGFYLMTEPWFSVVVPVWYSVIGIISGFLIGYLTERFNGAVGLSAFMVFNWICFYLFAKYPSWGPQYTIDGVIIAFIISIISGFIGDIVARYIAKFIKPYFQSIA
ncbi:hypothetical protein ACPB8Q_02415 [Methanocaldococcus indicus]|uniref:hypothetical protein n=1 Tax=Methanocaldococcus indicus TaxID=213231 RepID=UPI003C6D81EE